MSRKFKGFKTLQTLFVPEFSKTEAEVCQMITETDNANSWGRTEKISYFFLHQFHAVVAKIMTNKLAPLL